MADPGQTSIAAAMSRIESCFSPTLSPDGGAVAFVSGLSGVPQAWVMPTAGGFPIRVTALDDPVGRVVWSPRGDLLALLVAPGGGMNQQVYVVRPDGTELRLLTAGGKETNRLGPWSSDGRELGFSSNRRLPSAMDHYVVDVDTGSTRLLSEKSGVGDILSLGAEGGPLIVSRVESRGDSNLLLVDRRTGREVLLTPHEPPATFAGAELASNGSTVYLGSNLGREMIAFASSKVVPGGTAGTIDVLVGREDADLQQFKLDRSGHAFLLWNCGGQCEMEVVDLTTSVRTPSHRLPSEVVADFAVSNDGSRVVLACTGSKAPLDLWRWDRSAGTMVQLTNSPHPGVQLDTLIQPTLERFVAFDGLPLSGWLYVAPAKGSSRPIVLSYHGGPESQERPLMNSTYQALVAAGISVFAPNVRGSSGFGKTFVNLDNGALRFDAVRDIGSCVEFVVSHGYATTGHVGIMGGSYGGYMTMAGITEYPELFAAAVNLYGIVNFETFFQHTEPWMAAISTVKYGDPATQADLLKRLSPIHKIDQVVTPTLVLHGANDTNVPVIEAEQVAESLRQRGVPVEYIQFPDEGHGFVKAANRLRATTATVEWFARWLR